ncbi:MAG: divergent PAP2 family protein [Candidatus Omnitrophota bacterium]|nr:divergent PAP2 family protein [Candidatus Omnitrophota bacterium]
MDEHGVLWQFAHNNIAITTFSGWFVAQLIKVIRGIFVEKRFNFKWFVGTGGMPSSHAAGVVALTTGVGLNEGVHTALFIVTLMFTIIVICDAQGVRFSTGKQAEILNTIMEDIYWKKRIQEDKLKEFIGHTPIEVLMGIITGLFVAFGIYLMQR